MQSYNGNLNIHRILAFYNMFAIVFLAFFVLIWSGEGQPTFFQETRKITDNTRLLKIRGINIPSDVRTLKFTFSNQIESGIDYEILPRDLFVIPKIYQLKSKRGNDTDAVFLRLLKGKSWGRLEDHGPRTQTIPLYITNMSIIGDKTKSIDKPIQVATIIKRRSNCPTISSLPGAGSTLTKFLTETLSECQGIRVYKSSQLNWKIFNSWTLLYLDPPLFLIDGSDQPTQEVAGAAVDTFLAAHAVLEIAWEPVYPGDPSWWILIPRAKGMPGHLFGSLDYLQWRHTLVAPADKLKLEVNRNCTTDKNGIRHCIPGCPGTRLKGIIASGYNADAMHLADKLRVALYVNIPFQAAPVRLGQRIIPPFWSDKLGWSYTYGACPSNFLDCLFLDHSPCPAIDVQIHDDPRGGMVDHKRFEDYKFEIRDTFDWYNKAVGIGTDQPDVIGLEGLHGKASVHIAYSYLFRPKYIMRKEVQRRVDTFSMEDALCSIMHVRRGDSVFHPNQGRAYIAVETYVRAARPMMDALGIKHILLFTDSAKAIEEALRCETDFPEVCGGIKWRYIEKKRWVAGEGGWENPYPSGNVTEELFVIQNEFALAQKCAMAIVGESGYGNLLRSHMCCGFPLHPRGSMIARTSKCVCPPAVILKQWDFNCKHGNKVLCNDQNVGGNLLLPLNDPNNMLGANYSMTKEAYRSDPEVRYEVVGEGTFRFPFKDLVTGRDKTLRSQLKEMSLKAVDVVCRYRRNRDTSSHYSFCPSSTS